MLKTECEDLPDKVYETLYVEHTDQQREVYNKIANEALAQFDQGILTVTSAMTAINKLHQVNCGHLKLDGGSVINIESNRVSALIDELDKIGDSKAIIWCRFQRDVELIMEALRTHREGRYAVDYYGNTPDHARRTNLLAFKTDHKCLWFVGTAATGGKSITLTEAHYVYYYSTDHNLEDRLQSEDRPHRHGQTNKVTYVDLLVRDTVDVRILENLKAKKDLSYEVLDKFRELVAPTC
jgi:SNF2 family DNA or RNA helicase